MPSRLLQDSEYWRNRADEARVVAEKLPDEHSKDIMLDIAKGYERMAARADQRVVRQSIGLAEVDARPANLPPHSAPHYSLRLALGWRKRFITRPGSRTMPTRWPLVRGFLPCGHPG